MAKAFIFLILRAFYLSISGVQCHAIPLIAHTFSSACPMESWAFLSEPSVISALPLRQEYGTWAGNSQGAFRRSPPLTQTKALQEQAIGIG